VGVPRQPSVVLPFNGNLLSGLVVPIHFFIAFFCQELISRRVLLYLVVGNNDLRRAHRRWPILGLTLEAWPYCRRKRIDLTNVTKLDGLHSFLPYSYPCVPVAFEYGDGLGEERTKTMKQRLAPNSFGYTRRLLPHSGLLYPNASLTLHAMYGRNSSIRARLLVLVNRSSRETASWEDALD
jgi:hypothetical protein